MTPEPMESWRVVMIGAGNVATSLARALACRCSVVQIYSHTAKNAATLAKDIGCPNATADLAEITADADCYIISVKDDAIASVISSTSDNGALWVHTSGSKPAGIFAGHRRRYGVLYPMQSFVKQIPVDFAEVPFFIEGSDDDATSQIKSIASSLSHKVYSADSETRRNLHIAAVLCCNFANHLWTLADERLRQSGLPFDVMLPLIKTTFEKLYRVSPAEAQTGPALRRDYEVINQHLSMLSGDAHEVYDTLSKSIMRYHSQKEKKT